MTTVTDQLKGQSMIRKTALLLLMTACWHSASTSVRTAAVEDPDLTWVHTFTLAEGNSVRGALVEVDGRLYGAAGEGGPNGTPECNSGANWSTAEHKQRCPGSLFSIGVDGLLRVEHAFTQLDDSFRNADGYHPYGSLVKGPGGWLYGVTQMGGTPVLGARGSGVLYRFNPTGQVFEVLHHFYSDALARDGLYPMGAPAPLPDGRVCGASKEAGQFSSGAVWCWSESGFTYAGMPVAAGGPVGGVTYARGLLHGVTNWGGAFNKGTYFTFNPDTLAITVVAPFPDHGKPHCCDDNTPIVAPLRLSDRDETLIVAREFGGPTGTGLIARLDASGIHVLREFDPLQPNVPGPPIRFSNATGGMANGMLTEGCDGMIYGTTLYGGASGAGAAYRFARDGTGFQLLRSFGFDSGYPYGGLVAADCALHGTTLYGTTFVNGRVFKLMPRDRCSS